MLRILLAEDDENHATLARLTLEDEGHRITAVSDGKRALEAITHECMIWCCSTCVCRKLTDGNLLAGSGPPARR